jgi:hypothetical protein
MSVTPWIEQALQLGLRSGTRAGGSTNFPRPCVFRTLSSREDRSPKKGLLSHDWVGFKITWSHNFICAIDYGAKKE